MNKIIQLDINSNNNINLNQLEFYKKQKIEDIYKHNLCSIIISGQIISYDKLDVDNKFQLASYAFKQSLKHHKNLRSYIPLIYNNECSKVIGFYSSDYLYEDANGLDGFGSIFLDDLGTNIIKDLFNGLSYSFRAYFETYPLHTETIQHNQTKYEIFDEVHLTAISLNKSINEVHNNIQALIWNDINNGIYFHNLDKPKDMFYGLDLATHSVDNFYFHQDFYK